MRPARTFVLFGTLAAATLLINSSTLSSALAATQDAKYTVVGTPTELGLAGYANILCGAVFIAGRDPNDAAKQSAYWMMPRDEQDKVAWTVERAEKLVRASLGGITREARFFGDQGCIIQPPHAQGHTGIHFTPVAVRTALPGAMSQPWPMGDRPDTTPIAPEIDRAKLDAAVNAAFADPDALTAAFVVVYKGHIIAERYMTGVTKDTQLESWSMGKSIISTLFSLLVGDGTYSLEQPVPIPAWRASDDLRSTIRNIDLLHMSGGLKFAGNQEPGGAAANQAYPDHYFVYTGAVNAFEYSINRPSQYPPNTDGRYRNCDPMTIGYLIEQAVKKRGEEYLTWPQRALFDRIGIRRQVMETDPYGNILLTGYDYGTARNWARLGLLYEQDGVWQGKRILPEGWTAFVSTLAPAWKRPVYGGLFWINGDGAWNLPKDVYLMAGAGGQNTFVVPSHHLVIVRMGHFRGAGAGRRTLNAALTNLMEAVPKS